MIANAARNVLVLLILAEMDAFAANQKILLAIATARNHMYAMGTAPAPLNLAEKTVFAVNVAVVMLILPLQKKLVTVKSLIFVEKVNVMETVLV